MNPKMLAALLVATGVCAEEAVVMAIEPQTGSDSSMKELTRQLNQSSPSSLFVVRETEGSGTLIARDKGCSGVCAGVCAGAGNISQRRRHKEKIEAQKDNSGETTTVIQKADDSTTNITTSKTGGLKTPAELQKEHNSNAGSNWNP